MSAAGGEPAARVSAQASRRWQAIDPLLPVPAAPPPGCGARLVAVGADGSPSAIGTCEHWAGAAGSLDLAWGASRRFELTTRLAGPDVPGALDQLLLLWRDHLAEVPGADGADTAAIVTWPSRDIGGVETLLRHGLAPLTVIAARTRGRGPAGLADGPPPRARRVLPSAGRSATAPEDVRIRRAGPADIDAVAGLGLEVIRYDAHFGSVTERPDTAQALRREAAAALARPEPWAWLAEHGGTPVGLLYAERPESAGWIAPMAGPAPVAYLMLMVVLPGQRGSGVGAELVRRLHREIDAAGVAVTLLHYAQLNPLSAPFWSQQGYRPLWTSWEASPARAIRG